MKPVECRLETRQGNWVAILSSGKVRPATKTELYLWLQIVELRKRSETVFEISGKAGD